MSWNHQVRVNQPRCLLHRYNKSTCSRCFDICITGAISFGTELVLDADACTSCMLCTSACPTDALTIEGFTDCQTVNTLAKADLPVLACSERESMKGHARGPCLGYLSLEHLSALPELVGKEFQVNMTACVDCENQRVLPILVDRVDELENAQVSIITDVEDLEFEEVVHSRRALLGMLGIPAFRGSATVVVKTDNGDKQEPGFAQKTLPPRMQLLNLASESSTRQGGHTSLESLYFTITIDESCDKCGACVAMCPTGALIQVQGEIEFAESCCTGCGLCIEFCPAKSMKLVSHAKTPHIKNSQGENHG